MSIKIDDEGRKTYVILGAQHSATSFISKLLEESGVKMGNTNRLFYENRKFIDLNREIIKKAGGHVPDEADILAVDVKDKIVNLIEESRAPFWGWKDPLTSLTAKKYLPYLEEDVYLICCFRKPKRVVESHIRREPKYGQRHRRKRLRARVDAFNRAILRAIRTFCELDRAR